MWMDTSCWYRVDNKKVFHKSEGKMQKKKNEFDLAESYKLSICKTTSWCFFLQKNEIQFWF